VRLETPTPHKTIDLSGLRCPHLISTTVRTIRKLEPGHVLQVITTDINAPSNMTAWSHQSGNELLDMYDEDGRFIFYFRRRDRAVDTAERPANTAGRR